MKTYSEYRDIINSYWFSKDYLEWMINGYKYDNEIIYIYYQLQITTIIHEFFGKHFDIYQT